MNVLLYTHRANTFWFCLACGRSWPMPENILPFGHCPACCAAIQPQLYLDFGAYVLTVEDQ